MVVRSAAIEGVSVVLRGVFTPSLFSPAWLLHHGLIGGKEFDAAEVEVIAREIASFKTGWLKVHVSDDSLSFATTDVDEFERIRDVASGVLHTIPETPIAALGINRECHFQIDSPDRWHAIGDELTPKREWERVLRLPGMRSVVIWGAREDGEKGRVQVQVEPSMLVKQAVFVAHNDHYTLTPEEAPENIRRGWVLEEPIEPSVARLGHAVEVLSQNWSDSLARAQHVIDMVSELGASK